VDQCGELKPLRLSLVRKRFGIFCILSGSLYHPKTTSRVNLIRNPRERTNLNIVSLFSLKKLAEKKLLEMLNTCLNQTFINALKSKSLEKEFWRD
jgi:hypothetical protein